MEETVKIKLIDTNGKAFSYWAVKGQRFDEIIEMAGYNLITQPDTEFFNKIRVEGEVSPLTEFEREKVRPAELKAGIRLADYCFSSGEVSVYLGKEYQPYLDFSWWELTGKQNINHGWYNKKIYIPGRHKEKPIPLYDRISKALGDYALELNRCNLNELFALDRTGRPALELNAIIQEKSRRVVYIGRQEQPIYGIIIQMGSNYLWTALLDLQSGQLVKIIYSNNLFKFLEPDTQILISSCRHNPARNEILHQLLVNQLNKMIETLLSGHNLVSTDIYRVAMIGNVFLVHWFLGFNVTWSGERPFSGIFSKELRITGIQGGLKINPAAEIIVLPLLGDIYGSDILAAMLALETDEPNYLYLYWEDEVSIILRTSELSAITSVPLSLANKQKTFIYDQINNFFAQFELDISSLDRIYWGSNSPRAMAANEIAALLPAEAANKVRNIGNLAFNGAARMLLNDINIVKINYIKEGVKII